MPPPGGRQTPSSKRCLRISASRSPFVMKSVTSCMRRGLYVASACSASEMSPSQVRSLGSP